MIQPPSTPLTDKFHRLLKRKQTKLLLLILGLFALTNLFSTLTKPRSTTQSQNGSTPTYFEQQAQLVQQQQQGQQQGQGLANLASLQYPPRVGKVHACFGECNPTYERALKTHERHSEIQGHPMFVLREKILSGLWSKPAYILSIILAELALPEEERLKWLLWNDADIVITNPHIPLDIFIPPSPDFDHINLLVTNDRNGLNNGVFLIRINDWSVKLLSGIISFHFFRPQVELKYTEQSGMEEMIKDTYWKKSVLHVPQFWFNSYPISSRYAHSKTPHVPRAHEFRAGGLQIHFASNRDGKRPDRMNSYMDITDRSDSPYAIPLQETWYEGNITEFWDELRRNMSIGGGGGGGSSSSGSSSGGGAATNFFPVKNEDGVGYEKVESLSDLSDLSEKKVDGNVEVVTQEVPPSAIPEVSTPRDAGNAGDAGEVSEAGQ